MSYAVLWGFHPVHQPTPIKFTSENIHAEQRFRVEHGWICGIYLQGHEPAGLRELARQEAQKHELKCPRCGGETNLVEDPATDSELTEHHCRNEQCAQSFWT